MKSVPITFKSPENTERDEVQSTFPVSTDMRSRVKAFDTSDYNEHITRIPWEEELMLLLNKNGPISVLLLHFAQEKMIKMSLENIHIINIYE